MESLRLEKMSKIIKANYQPIPTMPTSHSTALYQKFFLISNLNLPCCNLRPLTLALS